MDNGFITLHRKIKDNPVWQNSQLYHLFSYLLLTACYEDSRFLSKKYGEIIIKRGQLITGRHKLARELHMSPSTVRNHLAWLKLVKIIDIKPDNKKSLITVLKYDDYQIRSEKRTTEKTTGGQLEDNQRTQLNKDNKEINRAAAPATIFKNFLEDPKPMIAQLIRDGAGDEDTVNREVRKFIDHWTEPTKSGTKQKWETERTFELNRRIKKWFNNHYEWSKK